MAAAGTAHNEALLGERPEQAVDAGAVGHELVGELTDGEPVGVVGEQPQHAETAAHGEGIPSGGVTQTRTLFAYHVRYLLLLSRHSRYVRPGGESSAHGARTGREYIEALDQAGDPTSRSRASATSEAFAHPAAANVVQTYAQLFDLQHDASLRDVMTYARSSGERVACRSCSRERRRRRAARRGDEVSAEYALGCPRSHRRLLQQRA